MTPQQRVALVTGANRGLGWAIAGGLAEHGLHVVVAGRNEQAADAVAAELTNAGLAASAHQLDVTDPASVARAFRDTAKQLGRLDVLVNNAGIAVDGGQLAAQPDFERVRVTLEANLLGAWRCCAAAVREMHKHGYGRIVNITSHLGSITTRADQNVAYRISKAGLNALTSIPGALIELRLARGAYRGGKR